MGNARIVSIAMAAVVVSTLGPITITSADAAQRGGENCVAISGGIVENATVLDVVADGGTAISDASGGTGNLAADAGNDRDRDGGRNNRNNNNNRRNNRNNFTALPLDLLELRLQQTDTASAGNAGVATASADGGAVSIGDVNSGGNAGNAISVGDTVCPGAAVAPAGGGGKERGGNAGGGGRGGQIRALPSTGVGELGGGASSLLLALGALGFGGLSLGTRRDRRVIRIADR
jgi:hypothetical protein